MSPRKQPNADSSLDNWLQRRPLAAADEPHPKRQRHVYGVVSEPAPPPPDNLEEYWSQNNPEVCRRASWLRQFTYKAIASEVRRLIPLRIPRMQNKLTGMFLDPSGHLRLVGNDDTQYRFDTFVDHVELLDINCDDTFVWGSCGNTIYGMFIDLAEAESSEVVKHDFPFLIRRIAAHPSNPKRLVIGTHVGSVHVVDIRWSGPNIVFETIDSPRAFNQDNSKEAISALTWVNDHQIASAQRDSETIRFWDSRYANKRGVQIVRSLPSSTAAASNRTGITDLVCEEQGIVWALSRNNAIFSCHANSERPIMRFSSPGHLSVSKFQTRMSINRKLGLLAIGGEAGAIVMTLPPIDAHFLPQPVSVKGFQLANPAEVTEVCWTADNRGLMTMGSFWIHWSLQTRRPNQVYYEGPPNLPVRSCEVPITSEGVRYMTSI